jgi:hypothetical protein
MTGAYEFQRWKDSTEPGDWYKMPKGFWTSTAKLEWAKRTVFLACPVCGLIAGLPHQVDAQGLVHPSLQCPYPPCPMHLMPVKLLGWDLGAKPPQA